MTLRPKQRRSLVASFAIGLLAAGLAGSWPQTARAGSDAALSLQIIPQPQEVKMSGAGFDASHAGFIFVSDDEPDRFAARLLLEAELETHGIDCDIVPLRGPSPNQHRLWLGSGRDFHDTPHSLARDGTEGYELKVDSAGVGISAATDAGLFYGAQTLIQLLEQSRREGREIPGITITDAPTFDWRGRYFDGSQYAGTVVTTRANLEQEIKLLARYKLNCLVMDLYNLVPFKSFPDCADANTLSLADWGQLVELAHRYHVTLVPSLQSFAQMYPVIWNCDAGKPYREETCGGLICPSRPENIQFLQRLYRDLISVFKYSPLLGIGCSEVGMQWQGHYCPLCRERLAKGETPYDLYSRHVQSCALAVEAAAKEAGRSVRPMMWADEFYLGYNNQRWIGIEKVPTNVVMGHWQYWSRYQGLAVQTNHDYDGISGLMQRGFDVFFISASFEFNTYLHDLSPKEPRDGKWDMLLDSGICNIADQARWADAHAREGLPGKMWGGACATFSQHDIRCWDTTWFVYALQAEYAWGDPKRPLDGELHRFTDNFSATFYGARDQKAAQLIASAYRDLDEAKNDIERNNYLIRDIIGEYDIHDAAYIDNSLEASLKLVDELATHPKGPGKTVGDIRERCHQIVKTAASFRQELAGVVSEVQNTASLHYLILAAHKMENHGQRTLLLLDLSDAFQKIKAAQDAVSRRSCQQMLSDLRQQLDGLQGDTRMIADEMDELTHGGDGAGYHKVMASLDALGKRLKQAEAAMSL